MDNDPHVTALIRAAQAKDALVAVSNLTLIEAWHSKIRMDRLRWHVFRLAVLPVTDTITWRAVDLLHHANLHGHKYAIDAVVAATALDYTGPRVVVTSDADDMTKLCGNAVPGSWRCEGAGSRDPRHGAARSPASPCSDRAPMSFPRRAGLYA
ncbi:PIN domain-containing protein [Streptomyces sp. NPDC054884]|uniref:PIN domain-containing protein n=1 Tax=Streptomyces sp. ME08-AFT2 TaxID=3028683 RepID=UPI0029BC52E5|nr:PIN domain-containing protein [Streptomyces sp. ME08-AFT2]MDX3307964.1 DNA-binding protein [Streptomyces sp. ME08-AFT2]